MKLEKGRLSSWTKQDVVKGVAISSVILFLMVFLVFPMITLLIKAFQNSNGEFVGLSQFIRYLENPALAQSIGNTIYIAVMSTTISVSLAFVFAYILTRKNVPYKGFFRYVAMLPIFSPTMLLGISLIYLFGNKGIFTQMGVEVPLYGSVGIIMAESIYCFPIATMLLMVAFSSADNRLYEAADTLGTSPLRKMMTITIPGVKYGLISAVFVCFTYSFTDFGAPSVVGGSYNVLATDVYKQVIGQQNFNMGAVVGILLLFPAIISFFVDQFANKRQDAGISAKSVPYQIKKHPPSDIAATLFCGVVALTLLLFFGMALYASLVQMWPYNLELTLSHYNFNDVAAGGGVSAYKQSVMIAAITAVVGTVIAFMAAYLVEKNSNFAMLRKIAYFLAKMPLAIPGTVIGLSFILFFNAQSFPIPFSQYSFVNPVNGLYGTVWIIILVNIVHFFSVPFVTATTALKRLDQEFETVSNSLRVPFYITLRRVTIPLCMPAIIEMAVYFFVNAMVTVSAVIFLYSPDIKVAAVSIVNMQDAGDVAPAAAMSILLLFTNIAVRLVYEVINKELAHTRGWMNR